MEFNFFIQKEFVVDQEGFFLIEGSQLTSTFLPSTIINSNKKYTDVPMSDKTHKLAEILNRMGEASAKAQDLRAIITCYEKVYSSDVKVFMKVEDNKCLGFLKTGKKNLFHRDYAGNVKQITPLCVLDFYVHESVQRNGIGKQLFEKMLEIENKKPYQLAYDRPSPKLISFLKKHYNLVNYIPQNNNFVIYQQFFENVQRPNSESSKNQKMNISENKFSLKNNISPALSPHQTTQREDFSKLGKQLLEKNYSKDTKEPEIPNLKEINYINSKKYQAFNEKPSFSSPKNETNSLKPTNVYQSKLTKKEELQLLDIQNKISRTEKELSEVQNKLSTMQVGYNAPNPRKNNISNPLILQAENKPSSYNVRPPWGTTYAMNNMNTTSNSYGSHYYQKYYQK